MTPALRELPAIQQLPESLQPLFASLCELRRLKNGEVLQAANRKAEAVYCTVSGAVRLYSHNLQGERVLVTLVRPNYWFGTTFVCDGGMTLYEAVASGDTVVLMLPAGVLRELMQRNAELNRLCMDWLCFANRAVWNSLTASLTLPLPQRLAQQLLGLMQGWGERAQRGVRIATKVSHEDLAEMLGATRQRIHQIMHEWEAEGIVGRDKPYIVVLKKREITRMAGISL